jgi:hypothetical protein
MNLQGVQSSSGYGAPMGAFDEVFDQPFAAAELCLAAFNLLGGAPGVETPVADVGFAWIGLGDSVGDDVHTGGVAFDGGVGGAECEGEDGGGGAGGCDCLFGRGG